MTEDDHLKKLEEWQEHQYSPGYYVGKAHPLLAANRNPKLLGLALIIAAIFLLLGVMPCICRMTFFIFAFPFRL